MYPLNFHYLYGTVLYLRVNLFVLSIPLLRLFCASKRFEFTLGFLRDRVPQSQFSVQFFVNHSLYFRPSSFGHCIICPLISWILITGLVSSNFFFMLNTIRINMITSTELKYILLVLQSFYFWPVNCLFVFDLRLLITALISFNLS